MKWLVIYSRGPSEIVEADDLYEIHNQVDSTYVVAVIQLDDIRNGYIVKTGD